MEGREKIGGKKEVMEGQKKVARGEDIMIRKSRGRFTFERLIN